MISRRLIRSSAAIVTIVLVGIAIVLAQRSVPRYDFGRDNLGRLVRLDVFTGESTIVESAEQKPSTAASSKPSATRAVSGRSAQPDVEATEESTAFTPARASEASTSELAVIDETSIDVCRDADVPRVGVAIASADVFVSPGTGPLTTFVNGAQLWVFERSGDWLLIRFTDPRGGERVGYVHCSHVRSLSGAWKSVADQSTAGTSR